MTRGPSSTRLAVAWSIVVTISVGYLWLDHAAAHGGVPRASTVVTVTAICLAACKVRIIVREFMEVQTASVALRRLADGLILVMAVAMLGVYVAGRALA